MKISTENLLNSILEGLDGIHYVKPDDIPNIDLYMDQVTTFIDKKMKGMTRKPTEDKILTKTMINNYAKNDLLPSPEKKKYSKEHILILIFIYYFKGILSISDIQKLLAPLTEQFFHTDKGLSLESIYETVFRLEDEQITVLKEDMVKKFDIAYDTFTDAPEDTKEFLQQFTFICLLSFDVYMKKLIIEKMIDEMNKPDEKAEEPSQNEKKQGKE